MSFEVLSRIALVDDDDAFRGALAERLELEGLTVTPFASAEAALKAITDRFEGVDVPRPEHWTGWRLVPDSVEFWRDRPFRLHDRLRFDRAGPDWTRTRLWP
jgi:pyridoxine/pyridoxamine 5'-phosphate oxidase